MIHDPCSPVPLSVAFAFAFAEQVVLSPTLSENFEVISTRGRNSILTLALKYTTSRPEIKTQGSWADVQNKDDAVDMKVISIDTGAGPVQMPGGAIALSPYLQRYIYDCWTLN